MSIQCDVPPDVQQALSDFQRSLGSAMSDVADSARTFTQEFQTLQDGALTDGNQILDRVYSNSDTTRPPQPQPTEETLSRLGIHISAGKGINGRGNNLTAIRQLYRLLGSDQERLDEILGKSSGEFVLGVSYMETEQQPTQIGCGVVRLTDVTSEVVLGVDISITSLLSASYSPSDIRIYVFWIQDSSDSLSTRMRLEGFGLDSTSASFLIASAATAQPNGTLPAVVGEQFSSFQLITSVIIEDVEALQNGGVDTPNQISAVLSPDRTLPGVAALEPSDWLLETTDVLNRNYGGPVEDSGSVGVTPTPDSNDTTSYGTASTRDPVMQVLGEVDLNETFGYAEDSQKCRANLGALEVLIDLLDSGIGILEGIKDTIGGSVQRLMTELEDQVAEMSSMLGIGGAVSELACLLGPVSFSGGVSSEIVADISSWADDLVAQVDAPITALLALFGSMNTPLCMVQAMMGDLMPKDGCSGVGNDLSWPECVDDLMSSFSEMLNFITDMVGKVSSRVSSLLSYIEVRFSISVLDATISISNCVGAEALAFSTALKALSV